MLFGHGIDVPACCTVRKLDVAKPMPVTAVIDEDVVRFDIYTSGSASAFTAEVRLTY